MFNLQKQKWVTAGTRFVAAAGRKMLAGRRLHPIEVFLRSPWMNQFDIQFAVDVGANEGQFAQMLRAAFPNAFLVSFEPMEEPFAKLVSNFRGDKKFSAHKVGLGAKKEIVDFYKTDFGPASSFLRMRKETESAFSIKQGTNADKIQVDTLENVLSIFKIPRASLLKVDTQGFELNVLKGAKGILHNFEFVLLELSLHQLYDQEPLFDEVYQFMLKNHFVVKGFLDVLKDPSSGQHLQVDALFGRA